MAFVQEYKSSQSIEALNCLAPPHCRVLRDAHTLDIRASDLVPGDVIRFTRGDRIPADARLIASTSLEVDESTLTGENEPVRKGANPSSSPFTNVSRSEKANIVSMGSLVRNGHGSAVVYAIGNETSLGSVMKLVAEVSLLETLTRSSFVVD